MKDGKKAAAASLEESTIVQAEVLDQSSVVIQFSNGSAAKVDLEKLKEFVLQAASEIVLSGEEPDS